MIERFATIQDLLDQLLIEEHYSVPFINHEILRAKIYLAERYAFELKAHSMGVNPEGYYRAGYSYELSEIFERDIWSDGYAWETQEKKLKRKLTPTVYQVIWRKKENEYGPKWTPKSALIAMSFGRYVRDAEDPVAILEGILKDKETLNGRTDYVRAAIEDLRIRNCQ